MGGIKRQLPNNEFQAAVNANTPGATNPFATETITSGLQTQINSLTPSNVLISGAVVYSGTGFIYDVTALVYKIQGVQFTTVATSVILATADPTNPRIDVIYADNTGTVGFITGVPAASPVKPTVNPLTQLELTFVTVPAGATAPVVTTTLVYDENTGTPTEWVVTSDDANIDFASILDPYIGLVSINTLLPLGTNREIIFTPAVAYPINGGTVNFRIKAKTPMNTPSGTLFVGFFNGATLLGNAATIGGSNAINYGFDPNNTTAYQLVAIPLSAFGALPSTVGALRIFKTSGGSTSDFFLDLVQIQEGVPTPIPPTPGHSILDESAPLIQRPKLSFQGAGVTASDDSINDQTVITIAGGGGGSGADTVQILLGTIVASGAAASGYLLSGNELNYFINGSGGGVTKQALLQFVIPRNYVSGGSLVFQVRRTGTPTVATSAFINGTINLNSTSIAPVAASVWETISIPIPGPLVIGQSINFRIDFNGANGNNIELRQIYFNYN